MPIVPEEPKRNDFIDSETEDFNEAEFLDTQNTYLKELEEYKLEQQNYQTELMEIEQQIIDNLIEPCFVIRGDELIINYCSLTENEKSILSKNSLSNISSIESIEKTNIAKLCKKMNVTRK